MELMCLAADRKELVDAINTITGGKMKYQLIELLKDCSAFEKRVIFEQARAIKKIIRENLPLVENKEKY